MMTNFSGYSGPRVAEQACLRLHGWCETELHAGMGCEIQCRGLLTFSAEGGAATTWVLRHTAPATLRHLWRHSNMHRYAWDMQVHRLVAQTCFRHELNPGIVAFA